MLLHAKHAAEHANTILIKSPDTDLFLFAIACCQDIGANLVFETGAGNSQRRLSINSIAATLGSRWCKALIGFHFLQVSGSRVQKRGYTDLATHKTLESNHSS